MKKNMKIKLAASIFILLTGGAVFAKAKAKTNKKALTSIRIGNAGGVNAEIGGPVGVAKKLGFFEEEFAKIGINKVEYAGFDGGPVVNEAFVAGELDFAAIGDVPGLTGLVNKVGSVWIGEGDSSSPVVVAVKKGSSIKKAEDLKGKTVAVAFGTAYHNQYYKYFIENKISFDDFETVNLLPSNATPALLSGSIDAQVVGFIYVYQLYQKGEIDIIFNTAKDKPEWSQQNWFIGNRKLLKEHPEAGVAFFKALLRARKAVVETEGHYYELLTPALKAYPEYAAQVYNYDGNFSGFNLEITDKNIAQTKSLYDFLKQQERVNGPWNEKTFVDTSYYFQALKELNQ